MADVRQGVDALDRELVALLTRRQAYMDAAARIKPARTGVRDVARIEDVVAKVAKDLGAKSSVDAVRAKLTALLPEAKAQLLSEL
jgi:isochorismate pyruvate lyase